MPIQKTACWLAAPLLAGLVACSDSNDTFNPNPPPAPEPGPTFSAEVRRTEFGIPHVKADDWGGLGYGIGYAYAQDNFCVTMREVIFSIGRSAELLGEEEGNVNDDLLFTYLTGPRDEFEREFIDNLPQRVKDLNEGYVAGFNRYLEETGVENLPEGDLGCRGEDWVFPINATDLFLLQRRQALRGSSGNGTFSSAILATEGPDSSSATAVGSFDEEEVRRAFRQVGRSLRDPEQGSNAMAAGRDMTQTGSGLLLGNPHQPWFGEGAWYEAHLTIPGEVDVAGAVLHGFPYVGIGFNKDVAWTHTVSIANRYSLYELQLNPEDPLQYFYDGELRDIVPVEVTVQSKQADGTLVDVTKTFYDSQFGPIVNFASVDPLLGGWPLITGTILAFKDANLETGLRGSDQWLAKAAAGNLDEYLDAISALGNPVFHEIVADRNGEAFYGDISAIPFIDQAKIDSCLTPLIGRLLAQGTTNVLLTLDGSTSSCEWGVDPEAPEGSGLFGPSALPQLRTFDYVGNSNNSYWLSDANNPLTGFPTTMGPVGYEGLQQFLRTRIGHITVEERRQATDGFDDSPLFNNENLKAFMYQNRVYGAELNIADVLSICQDPAAATVQDACDVLQSWDLKVELDSRGAQVWKEFWSVIRRERGNSFQNVVDSDEFWLVDFDPADPLNTPAGIDASLQVNRDLVINALAEAKQRLADNNVALDARWGDIQYLVRNNENVPIHGGQGTLGIYGAISSRLSNGGYINPTSGNSYIQIVTWDESECPIADVILVPSQSTDPDSPHFADQTRLYSNKEWVRFPFCEDDIQANQIGETLVLEGS
ncbi:MAG: penicillin acylase family protein [Halieaceae bacterium]|nr:penicillin acylase family protein [Halieaceae bacterium]